MSPSSSTRDARLMALALTEARRGLGRTSPNPNVGCVIVAGDAVAAVGYHARAGGDHAEVDALRKLGMRAEGAEVFVTLEPCNHTGRTGPCTEAIIASGARRVVVGARDPNPAVSGGGIDRLRAAGVEVEDGVLRAECEALVRPFARWATRGLPTVTLKQAATLDGAVADSTGVRRWVTGPLARERVHRMRDFSDALVVGVGTVVADDPLLTTRLPEGGRDPLRVVLDTTLRMPASAAMLRTGGGSGTLVLTAAAPDNPRASALRAVGADVVSVGARDGVLDLDAAMREVARRGCLNVLAEAGPRLAGALLRAGLVSRVAWFFAPRILGDPAAPRLVDTLGLADLDAATRLAEVTVERVGEDILIEGMLPEGAANAGEADVYGAC